MVCLLTSSVCHTLGCCAQHISLTVWRFDYVGIAVLIVASFYPPVSSVRIRTCAFLSG
jgi:predicted membrane channel-forming protein YqfA (hemolysin III family)